MSSVQVRVLVRVLLTYQTEKVIHSFMLFLIYHKETSLLLTLRFLLCLLPIVYHSCSLDGPQKVYRIYTIG